MKIIIYLLFAHFLLDWSLQDEMTKHYKSKSNFVLAVHCIIWSLGISILLMYLGLFAWWKLVMLLIGHYLMDYWKCRGLYKKWFTKKSFRRNRSTIGRKVSNMNDLFEDYDEPIISDMQSLYIDQAFHVIQLMLCLI